MNQFFLVFFIVNIINAEKIILQNLELKPNKLFPLAKFTYNNYTKEGPINQGFKYEIKLNFTKTNINNNSFKFFYILSEPSLSVKKSFCDNPIYLNNDGKNSYIKNYTINNSSTIINDNFTFYEKGVKSVYFYFCNKENVKNIDEIIYLNGEVDLFNTNTYESAENFFRSYLYLVITCYYGIFAIYWIYQMVTKMNKINILMVIFSIIIPFILLENIMRLEFYKSLSSNGTYNYPFKIMEVVFRCIKSIGIRIIYFFIACGFQTLNKFPNKADVQFFLIILLLFLFSFVLYEASLIQYESDFINHPIIMLFVATIIFLIINAYMWFFYIYRKIKIFEKNFREKNFKKNEKILNSYSFSLFAGFLCFFVYVIIFIFNFVFTNLFIKVYFKWVGDLADRLMSVFYFTTICVNLWEENETTNYIFDKELNSGNKYYKAQNESSGNGTESKKKVESNLPKNEENKNNMSSVIENKN